MLILIYQFIYSLIYIFNNLSIYNLFTIYLFVRLFVRSLVRSFTRSCMYLFIYLSVCPYIPTLHRGVRDRFVGFVLFLFIYLFYLYILCVSFLSL